jgi:gamma-glutamyltranspeptidase/glutathione hydrolase
MKLAFADIHRHISDPCTMEVSTAQLLDKAYLTARAREIDPQRAQVPVCGIPPRGGTVYLSAADAEGRMVSFVQSNFMGFGSGVVVPGTGIGLQNRGYGFTLEPGHPNQVAGGKRPFHTIIPAFVTQGNTPLMSFGVMGGAMQAQGHAQMMVRIFQYGQNPQFASDAPRWQVLPDGVVGLEDGFDATTWSGLEARGHQLRSMPFPEAGGAQLIYRLNEGYLAASDWRKDGQAVGY